MKKVFIAIIIIIVVVLTAPKFIGSVVQTEYKSAFDKLNENPAITINSTAFTQNWFNGKSVTEMTIILESQEIDDITIVIEENLSFGPVIFTDEGVKFALNYSEADINFKDLIIDEEVSAFINDKLHLSSLLTYSKNVVTKIVIDEISKEVDGNNVVSAKAVGNFMVEDNKRFSGDFNWAGLTATTKDESFTISEVKLSVDQTLIAGDFYQGNAISTGDFDFSIASINGQDAAGNAVMTIDNLLVSGVSSVSNDLMKINMNYHADKLVSAGQQLENANITIVLDGFNINVMQEVNALMTAISGEGDAMFNPENMAKISVLIEKLLADNPVIEIKDFSVQTPEGKIESAMQVSVDKQLFDKANMMSIMAAVQANAHGKAPMPFFTKLGLAAMVDMYVEQGFIIQKEQELSFKVNFAQGQLQVNGNVIPL